MLMKINNPTLKILFSYVSERTKLDLIMYNKNLQKKLDINLINYKFLSEKYLVLEENGKGKEFDGYCDYLLFEGEYSNGKKNGKGKEYDEFQNMIFEGEYLNGKRNGKGRIYNEFGYLIYEGEFLNGEINGKGKLYYKYGYINFEGEYLNGKKWNGKIHGPNGKLYEIKNGNGYSM